VAVFGVASSLRSEFASLSASRCKVFKWPGRRRRKSEHGSQARVHVSRDSNPAVQSVSPGHGIDVPVIAQASHKKHGMSHRSSGCTHTEVAEYAVAGKSRKVGGNQLVLGPIGTQLVCDTIQIYDREPHPYSVATTAGNTSAKVKPTDRR
jgi:hypothetical protein